MDERRKDRFVNFFTELQTHWRCELRSCHNFGFTCLIYQRRHYKLNVNQLKLWSNAIQVGKATVHTPPLEIHPMPNVRSKKRKHMGYSSDPEESPWHRGSKPNINFHVDQRNSKNHSSYVITSSPPCSPSANQLKRPSSSSSSGSIELHGNDDEIMQEYITWHVNQMPKRTAVLFEALEKLKSALCTLKQLKGFSAETWAAVGIPLGIGLALSSQIDKFKAEYIQKGVSID
jgi:hypothetical protein